MFVLPPPVITVQPSPRTQYVGESATFSVVLQAPGAATFQWRRNGVAIAGATSFLYVTPPLTAADDNESIDVVVTSGAESVTSKSAGVRVGPFAVGYTTSAGEKLTVYAWPGRKIAYLTRSNALSPSIMRNLLATTDELWDYYASATGHLPEGKQKYEGLAIVAQTDGACGAACTPVGAARMELTYAEMRAAYTAQAQGTFDEAIFTAVGRAFDFYSAPLAYKQPDSEKCIPSGVAALLRERALLDLAKLGSSIDPSGNTIKGPPSAKPWIAVYAETPELNWSNTFRTNTFQPAHGVACSDLVVSLLNSLLARFGGEPFLHSFLREAEKRPAAESTQEAVDNFVLAASAAARTDLAPQFKVQWRWPLARSAEDEARERWPLR